MERVFVTGASGYVGKLVAAALLAGTDARLVLPVRGHHVREEVEQQVLDELAALDPHADEAAAQDRMRVVLFEADGAHDGLADALASHNVTEVVHCAGCLDYFDDQALQAVNVDLTQRLLEVAQRRGIARFVYLSTAFSSGYIDGTVPEALHEEPQRDPTAYTRSKRVAERLVARSGLATLIVRPSIVIGHSQTGRYTGKQYGLYQLWAGIERLLCSDWEPEFHTVAPRTPLNVVHQDGFQRAFLAARARLPAGAIVNVVSDRATCPLMRELWDLWIDDVFQPQRRYYYDSVDDLPVRAMPRRQRALMALASVNLEIATHPWQFDMEAMSRLALDATAFPHATLASVRRCHDRFVSCSTKVQRFLAKVANGGPSAALATA
jgi:nucleoside-diphosphate-sugar epimerase